MKLFAKILGQGEPLVILHGLFGSLNNWNTLGQKFAEDFTVFLVDQRNHGRSPHDPVHSYEVMAQDLLEFFEEHAISAAHLVGHSMGGKTAMEFALSHSDRVKKLVVVDMSPGATAPTHDTIFEALTSLHLGQFTSRESIDEALKRQIPDETVRQFLLTNLKRDEGGGFAWKMNLDALNRNYGEMNRGIENGRKFQGRTLFLAGGNSSYVTEEDVSSIKALFPRVQFRSVPGVGHWVHAEAPDQFLTLVRDFISSS
jgi:esterase